MVPTEFKLYGLLQCGRVIRDKIKNLKSVNLHHPALTESICWNPFISHSLHIWDMLCMQTSSTHNFIQHECGHWLWYAKQLSQLTQILVQSASAMWKLSRNSQMSLWDSEQSSFCAAALIDREIKAVILLLVNLHRLAVTQEESWVRVGILPFHGTWCDAWNPDSTDVEGGEGGGSSRYSNKPLAVPLWLLHYDPTPVMLIPPSPPTVSCGSEDVIMSLWDGQCWLWAASQIENYNHSKMEKTFDLTSNFT